MPLAQARNTQQEYDGRALQGPGPEKDQRPAMPTPPQASARPVKADPARLGEAEAERQARLMARPADGATRFPGDGGQALPPGAAPAQPREPRG